MTTMRPPDPTGPARPLRQNDLKPCDVRTETHVPMQVATSYRTETTGKISYRFNSRGYRGEELDPDAAFRICVIGESHALGIGVDMRDTFGKHLKRHIARALDLPPAKVNSLNLSVSGISADYCVRTAFRQLSNIPVDLAVCCLPAPNRLEYCRPKDYMSLNLTGLKPDNLEKAPVPLLAFGDLYNPRMGLIALFKNALLLQGFFRQRGIGYVLTSRHLHKHQRRADYLRDFDAGLDQRFFLDDRIFDLCPDRAVDGAHAGPRSHAAFAIAVLDRFAAGLRHSGDRPDLSAPLSSYVRLLKRRNPDWAFCRAALTEAAQARSEPTAEPAVDTGDLPA